MKDIDYNFYNVKGVQEWLNEHKQRNPIAGIFAIFHKSNRVKLYPTIDIKREIQRIKEVIPPDKDRVQHVTYTMKSDFKKDGADGFRFVLLTEIDIKPEYRVSKNKTPKLSVAMCEYERGRYNYWMNNILDIYHIRGGCDSRKKIKDDLFTSASEFSPKAIKSIIELYDTQGYSIQTMANLFDVRKEYMSTILKAKYGDLSSKNHKVTLLPWQFYNDTIIKLKKFNEEDNYNIYNLNIGDYIYYKGIDLLNGHKLKIINIDKNEITFDKKLIQNKTTFDIRKINDMILQGEIYKDANKYLEVMFARACNHIRDSIERRD